MQARAREIALALALSATVRQRVAYDWVIGFAVGDLQGVGPVTTGEARESSSRGPRKPNTVLRGIRENERRESQSEFAEAMAQVAREMDVEVYPDGQYVQRLESGYITWPHRTYRAIIEALCGRSARELGFAPSVRSRESSEEVSSRVNARLREAVWASGMEPDQFARKIGVDPKTAERWITRGVTPQPIRRWKISFVLGIDESEIWPDIASRLNTPAVAPRKTGGEKKQDDVANSAGMIKIEEDQEEMERRRLLQSLVALGVDASPFSHALEVLRSSFGDAVGYDERNHLECWEEAAIEYGYSYLAVPPRNLVANLAADLIAIRSIVRRVPAESSEYRSWCRVAGTLSGLMAKTLSNLSQSRDARQWWNMAEHLTDISGDFNLSLWVRGQRIIHGLYENRPFQILSRQAHEAIEFSRGRACAGLADVTTGYAQVSVLSGDDRSAEQALRRTEEILEQLPSTVTGDTSSVMGWGEAQLRYTQAWVYAHIGNEIATDQAIDRALQLYPDSDSRSPTQVKLVQAFSRIQSGDISEGIRSARVVYEPLVSEHRTTMVEALALRVLNSVPHDARNRTDVAEYRALMTPSPRKMIEQ